MAAQVNVKFVAALSVGLMLTAGLAVGAAYLVLNKDGSDYEVFGDAALAEGDLEKAEKMYGRAVGHDNTNLVWLDKWEAVIEQNIPPTQEEYREKFDVIRGIAKQRAQVLETDIDAHDEFLAMQFDTLMTSAPGRIAYDILDDETENALLYFSGTTQLEDAQRLRRYRAIYGVRLVTAGIEDADSDEFMTKLNEDLRVTREQAPGDERLAAASVELAISLDRTNPEAVFAAAREARAFAAANPAAVLPASIALSMEAAELRQDALTATSDVSERLRLIEASYPPLQEELARIADATIAAGVDRYTPERVQSIRQAESSIRIERGMPQTVRVAEALSQGGDPNGLVLLTKADAEQLQGDYEAAIATLERARELPNLEVSLQGWRRFQLRITAAEQLVERAGQAWSLTPADSADRTAAFERMERYATELGSLVPDTDPRMLRARARVELFSGDPAAAQRTLAEYQTLVGDATSDISVLRMLAQASFELRQLPVAQRYYRQLLAVEPGNIAAMIQLALINSDLGSFAQSLDLVDRALTLQPDNPAALEAKRRVEIASGVREADDPVVQTVLEAQRLAAGDSTTLGSIVASIERLREGIEEHGNDPRLVTILARMLDATDRPDEARAIVELALQEDPENEELLQYRRMYSLDKAGRIEYQIELINESDKTDWEKALDRSQMYRHGFRDEEAIEELRKAFEIAPEEPIVIERAFVAAIAEGMVDWARDLADRAESVNADNVSGLTYRARLFEYEGRTADAARTLEEATRLDPTSARIFAMLGATRMNLNQPDEAITAYRRSLEIQPSDQDVLVALVRGLVAGGYMERATDIAREYDQFGRGSEDFEDLRIGLEAQAGNYAFAIAGREQIARDFPDKLENKASLANMYIASSRWDDARSLLDDLINRLPTGTATIRAIARWHTDQGSPEDALNEFQEIMIELDPDTITVEPYLAFGTYMIDRGFSSLGMPALIEARDFQDPATQRADRAIAEAQIRLNETDAAIDTLTGALENASDPTASRAIRQRLVETLLVVNRGDEASSFFEGFSADEVESNPGLLRYAAQIAAATGNRAEALRMLDDRVAGAPRDPAAYLDRARFYRQDRAFLREALDDADAAVTLSGEAWNALTLRAEIKNAMGDTAGYLADLRTAALDAPQRPDLRSIALSSMLGAGRESEAGDLGRQLLEALPGDVVAAAQIAELFAQNGAFDRSAEFYASAWERRQRNDLVPGYVTALLKKRRPDTGTALDILDDIPPSDFDGDADLLMARARALIAIGEYETGGQSASAAFALVPENPAGRYAWFANVRDLFEDRDELLSYLVRAETETGAPEWAALFRSEILAIEPADISRGVQVYQTLVERGQDPVVRRLASQSIGNAYNSHGQYAEAVDAWRAHLGRYSDDWTAANNAAFVLAAQLESQRDALPLAEQAVAIAPEQPTALDTLGYVRLQLGEFEAAREALESALERAPIASRVAVEIRIHLAETLIRLADLERAATLLTEAETLAANAGAQDRYADAIQTLRADLPATN